MRKARAHSVEPYVSSDAQLGQLSAAAAMENYECGLVGRGAGGGGGEVACSVSATVVDEPSWSEKRGLPPQPPIVKLHEIATLDPDSQIWRLD